MNPLQQVIDSLMYEPWDEQTKSQVKQMIMLLEIQGLVDVRFKDDFDHNTVHVIPVFETEQDYLKLSKGKQRKPVPRSHHTFPAACGWDAVVRCGSASALCLGQMDEG